MPNTKQSQSLRHGICSKERVYLRSSQRRIREGGPQICLTQMGLQVFIIIEVEITYILKKRVGSLWLFIRKDGACALGKHIVTHIPCWLWLGDLIFLAPEVRRSSIAQERGLWCALWTSVNWKGSWGYLG